MYFYLREEINNGTNTSFLPLRLSWGGIKNTQEVNIEGQYSLDACQNNPDYPNSLRQVINGISEKVESNQIAWHRRYLDANTDANNCRDNGVYRVSESQELKNFAIKNGFLIVFTSEANSVLQINTDYSGGILYFRTYWHGTWFPWKRIAFAS